MATTAEKVETRKKRLRFKVGGVVQGVGFRPFVYSMATKQGLAGFVKNDGAGVVIEVEGEQAVLAEFLYGLENHDLPLAHITEIRSDEVNISEEEDFVIQQTDSRSERLTLVSPDVCVCSDCINEFFDKNDRRYKYPFINCTNCGPRFTIIEDIPYDRGNTTMRAFKMCDLCRSEYDDPLDRRFHAQPNACSVCGPSVRFVGRASSPDDVFGSFRSSIRRGEIVAVKGIGGFHLACNAEDGNAVRMLRERKGRIDKPFALMCVDIDHARTLADISSSEAELLLSKERPIVLVRKKKNALSGLVAPNNHYLGIMLPYSPLHLLLFDADLKGLVMTSGNYSDEPIIKDNNEALERLAGLADAFLLHDRKIHVQCDDSIVRGFPGTDTVLPIRRSRGYAPFPVELPFDSPKILAVGGELKSAFCLARGNFGFMSQHIGDMESLEALRAFERSLDQMKKLLHIEPEIFVGDMHPNYISSNWAEREFSNGENFIRVQHHHAHIASVMAENKHREGNVIGFAFDGTGYGTDGAIWGGEILIADYGKFTRAGHLRYFPLAGGDSSIKNVNRLALSLLHTAGIDWEDDLECVTKTPAVERDILRKQIGNNIGTVSTSSFGRLFDGIASIAGVRHTATYEAQAAIEFESVIDSSVEDAYQFEFDDDEAISIDHRQLVRDVVADVRSGVESAVISAKFHNAAADMIVRAARIVAKREKIDTVALSGGCFQNVALLQRSVSGLEAAGLNVLTHSKVPPNDGGLALGQAAIAAKMLGTI